MPVRQCLHDSWTLLQSSGMDDSTKMGSFGRLCCRVTLHVLGKEKHGREPHGHENLEVICKLFTDELNGLGKPTAVASSSKCEENSLEAHNVLASSAIQVALLQNPNLKVGQMHLGRNFDFNLF